MALLLGNFLKKNRIVLAAFLKQNLQISKPHHVSRHSFVSCHRPTNATGAVLLWRNGGRYICFNTVVRRIPPRDTTGAFTRCGRVHTSAPRRALPAPLVWMVLKPLQKLMAIIVGRSIRKWWVALPDNRRHLLREWMWRRRWRLVAGAGLSLVIIAILLLTHLDESPLTGRTRLLVFSKENYMELATFVSDGYIEEFAKLMLPECDPRHQVVERVIQHLVERNKDIPEVSEIDWTVHVVQDPKVNAFVLSNGMVFVFTGMLDAVTDVHQLTICPRDSLALLGHWAQEKLTQLMFSRPYSRKLEAEADEVGLQLAAKACADVRAGPVFWQQMEMRDRLMGEPELPQWLSTHPSHKNRYTHMDRLIPQALELRASCVCPPLPEADPRAVFSINVRVLLENAKKQTKVQSEGEPKPRPYTGPVPSLPTAAITALTPQPMALTSDQENKVPVLDNTRTSLVVNPDETDSTDQRVQCPR